MSASNIFGGFSRFISNKNEDFTPAKSFLNLCGKLGSLIDEATGTTPKSITVDNFPKLVRSSIDEGVAAEKEENPFTFSANSLKREADSLFPEDISRIATHRMVQIKTGDGLTQYHLPISHDEAEFDKHLATKEAAIQKTINAQPEGKRDVLRYSLTQGFDISFVSVPVMRKFMKVNPNYRLSQSPLSIKMDLSKEGRYTAGYKYTLCCKSMDAKETYGEPDSTQIESINGTDFAVSAPFQLYIKAHFFPSDPTAGQWELKDVEVVSIERVSSLSK